MIVVISDDLLRLNALGSNVEEIARGQWKCKQCGKMFITRIQSLYHVEARHFTLTNGRPQCEVCGKSAKSLNALRVHRARYHSTKHKVFDVRMQQFSF